MTRKVSRFRSRFLSIVFWSIISAAFIGPGTVTTAAKAGASFNLALLWALVFSIFATIVLQEAAARISIASGKSLGEIITAQTTGNSRRIAFLLFLAVAFGCAAYQAGNMLGAISGLELFTTLPRWITTSSIFLVGSGLLFIGNYKIIANFLGLIVAGMGVAFVFVAWNADLTSAASYAAFPPQLPDGSLWLAIGLVGTTIVPYNLFLASGISQGQDIQEMRWGITGAVLIGGLISIAILIVGTQTVGEEFSFSALANALETGLGNWAVPFMGLGLFAAGLSSSITAPLAAAITAGSLFDKGGDWAPASWRFRLVWLIVMLTGYSFAMLNFQAIPVIIAAQAINGLLLPIVTVYLILTVNNRALLGEYATRGWLLNSLFLLIVGVTCFLGLNNLAKALTRTLPGMADLPPEVLNGGILILIAFILFWIVWKLRRVSKS